MVTDHCQRKTKNILVDINQSFEAFRRMSYRQRKRLLEKYLNVFYRLLKVVQKYIVIQWIDK